MRAVGIKALRAKLSHYVKLAAAGETVLVTDRDRVVAQLIPPPPQWAENPSDALLADAVRQGLITPAVLPPGPPPPAPRPVMRFDQLLAALDEARADR